MVNAPSIHRGFLWTLLPCAVVLCLAACLRGAEYDEQYTLFLTAGVPRPVWPVTVFPAGLVREVQAGHSGLAAIARNLRLTDVHPPLYFWLIALWRDVFGPGLLEARLLSVLLGLGALALTGVIAQAARIPPALAMLLTLGCYGFTYTSVTARGTALAVVLLLAGVVGLLRGRRRWHFAAAGGLIGAATLTNYLAVFAGLACLLATWLEAVWPERPVAGTAPAGGSRTFGQAIAVLLGFLAFIPGDLWWFLAQRDTRAGQFPVFSLSQGLARLAVRFSGAILGGLPLYVPPVASMGLSAALGSLLIWLIARVAWRWRHVGTSRARILFGLAAFASPAGLLVLGAIFNTTPIEVRYLAFSTPFVSLLLAGALGFRGAALVLGVQAAAIAGLVLAPQTMQPARAAARMAAALVQDGVVLLPRGNDGVGVVGAFAIEAPPGLPLLLIPAFASPEQIRALIRPWHRVVLAQMEQDPASRAASAAMRQALTDPGWREVADKANVAVYVRVGDGE